MGKTALAGPLTNIILSTILTTISYTTPNYTIAYIAALSAWINAFMATFNLIPFGIMDGFKIFSWNRKVWVMIFAFAIILVILLAKLLF